MIRTRLFVNNWMLKFRQKEYLKAKEAPSSFSSFGLRYYKKSVHAPAWRVIPTDCEKILWGGKCKNINTIAFLKKN